MAAVDEGRRLIKAEDIRRAPQREERLLQGKFYNNFIYFRTWLSLVERLLWEQDAAGSNPVIRTIKTKRTFILLVLIFLFGGT